MPEPAVTEPRLASSLNKFRCAACGYGICVGGALPACPMCQASDWNRMRDEQESRGAEMATNGKLPVRDEHGAADERAQAKLTTSVGTPLEPTEKTSRWKLFGRRPERPAAGS